MVMRREGGRLLFKAALRVYAAMHGRTLQPTPQLSALAEVQQLQGLGCKMQAAGSGGVGKAAAADRDRNNRYQKSVLRCKTDRVVAIVKNDERRSKRERSESEFE